MGMRIQRIRNEAWPLLSSSVYLQVQKFEGKKQFQKNLAMLLPRVADDEPIETNRLHCADQATGHLKVAPGHNSDEKLVSWPKAHK